MKLLLAQKKYTENHKTGDNRWLNVKNSFLKEHSQEKI